MLVEWWTLRNGRTPERMLSIGSPATEWTRADSIRSASSSGGRIDGKAAASMLFPDPGGPVIRMP